MMVNWNKYRKEFPHLSDKVYLNHAAIAPQNLRAKKAIDSFWEQRLSKNIEFWPDALELRDAFKIKVGSLINCSSENIALVSNTSAGLNILALGLAWKAGDRILLNDFEFPANIIPFLKLKRLGVKIDFVKHRKGKILIEDIVQNIKPETKLLSISFVEFLNGFRNDLKTIGDICAEHKIIFSVDAIQGLGALNLDIQDMKIDFLSNGGHKWLMWPAGLGFIFVSPRIFDKIYPAQAGWLSLRTPGNYFDYHQDFAPGAQRFESGTFNTSALIAANATLEMFLEIGIKNIEKKILDNTKFLINELTNIGIELYSDKSVTHRSGIITFFHPKAEKVYSYLRQNQIYLSLRESKIRVSPHFYNNKSDLGILLKYLSKFEQG